MKKILFLLVLFLISLPQICALERPEICGGPDEIAQDVPSPIYANDSQYFGNLYIAGDDVDGKHWKLADPDSKFTYLGNGIYEWYGTYLGTEFKLNDERQQEASRYSEVTLFKFSHPHFQRFSEYFHRKIVVNPEKIPNFASLLPLWADCASAQAAPADAKAL